MRRLAEWGEQTETGDRAELDFEPDARAWAAVSVGPRECPGAFRCPSGSNCFTELARARAAAADIVVVNTHLYATHVASGGVVLPEHDAVVFDEAHEVEDIMTSGLGVELTPGRLRAVAQAARGLVGRDDAGILEGLMDAADAFEQLLRPLAGMRVLTASGNSRPGRGGEARPDPGGFAMELSGPGAPFSWGEAPASRPSERSFSDALTNLLSLIDGRIAAVTLALRQSDRSQAGELRRRRDRERDNAPYRRHPTSQKT